MRAGIEALHVYAGRARLDVNDLAEARGLDTRRFQNLLMREKTVALEVEDPVTFAVNAARPLLDRLSPAERSEIGLLVVATESGLDFGKPISTYIHRWLGLDPECRNFEVKHACFGGTAALEIALDYVRAGSRPGARALVITTDVARPIPHSYAEPSQGAAAVALLVGAEGALLELEHGAVGVCSYEVMDSCRPTADIETGDADLSLLSYLDCLERSFAAYSRRVPGADYQRSFRALAFHTPFGGIVRGAHRSMMRKLHRAPPPVVEEDYQRRVEGSLRYCAAVGNVYSGTLFVALLAVLEHGGLAPGDRVGLFSYGSGCCSQFYSGLARPGTAALAAAAGLGARLAERHPLSLAEYERLVPLTRSAHFGVMDATVQPDPLSHRLFAGRGLLVLEGIRGYHREYRWS